MHEWLSDVIADASIQHDDTECTASYSRAPIPMFLLRLGAKGRGGACHVATLGQNLRE